MKKNKKIKGYKVLNPDYTCRGFKYEVGKTYKMDEKPILCKQGFHFCTQLGDCFKYYNNNTENIIVEIEATGETCEAENDCSKQCTNEIKIIREISKQESLVLGNLGKLNTGYNNTGNWNTGNSNTGDWNTGDWNTGNWNTGNWNTGNWNTGFLNTTTPEYITVFDKKCKRRDWDNANKPNFLFFEITRWINESEMTAFEKEANPSYKIASGYLKRLSYKEAFIESFNSAPKHEIELLLKLPNFNYKVFEKISGISRKMINKKLKES